MRVIEEMGMAMNPSKAAAMVTFRGSQRAQATARQLRPEWGPLHDLPSSPVRVLCRHVRVAPECGGARSLFASHEEAGRGQAGHGPGCDDVVLFWNGLRRDCRWICTAGHAAAEVGRECDPAQPDGKRRSLLPIFVGASCLWGLEGEGGQATVDEAVSTAAEVYLQGGGSSGEVGLFQRPGTRPGQALRQGHEPARTR